MTASMYDALFAFLYGFLLGINLMLAVWHGMHGNYVLLAVAGSAAGWLTLATVLMLRRLRLSDLERTTSWSSSSSPRS